VAGLSVVLDLLCTKQSPHGCRPVGDDALLVARQYVNNELLLGDFEGDDVVEG
jgi:hypothetical protein